MHNIYEPLVLKASDHRLVNLARKSALKNLFNSYELFTKIKCILYIYQISIIQKYPTPNGGPQFNKSVVLTQLSHTCCRHNKWKYQ
jgi:hypothetical protein